MMNNNFLEVENIVWLGCGDCLFNGTVKLGCDTLYLIDASESAVYNNPSDNIVATQIDRKRALIAQPGDRQFHVLSPANLSSVGELNTILSEFPGCRHLETIDITPKSILEIIDEIELKCSTSLNALIIDFVQVEHEVLREFLLSTQSQFFSTIFLRLTRTRDGRSKPYQYIHLMELQGFCVTEVLNDDFNAIYMFSRDEVQEAVCRLNTKQQELTSTFQVIKGKLDVLDSEIAKIRNSAKETVELASDVNNHFGAVLTALESISTSIPSTIADTLKSTNESLDKLPKLFSDSLVENRLESSSKIDSIVKSRTANVVTQLEAYDTIKRFLQYGVLPVHFHGWPVSPDVGVRLIDMITSQKFDLIIEFGSGTSTLIMCSALAKMSAAQTRFISFDHLEKYYNSTLTMLRKHGVEQHVDLCHAPLTSFEALGNTYMHYDCETKLDQVYNENIPANVLVLVDGPPGATNKHARYPAFPKIINIFEQSNLTIFMDDYSRIDEKECVEMWEKEAELKSRPFDVTSLSAEKGLAIIKVGKREV
ncbi:hypothetical protein ACYTPF_16800 [Alteromonas sp. HB246098]